MDPIKNFAIATLSTVYTSGATSITLVTGEASVFPDVSTDGAFNLTWWNATDYVNAVDDPNKEIVRVTAISGDTLTVTRGQEDTTASDKNVAGKAYKVVLSFTKKTYDEIDTIVTTALVADDINVTVQAHDDGLQAISDAAGGSVLAEDQYYYGNASDDTVKGTITAAGRSLAAAADASSARVVLGLGTAATTDASDYAPALGADDNYVTNAEKVVVGNTSGTNTGDQTNITGNAGTATALNTPREIAGVAFDGTANISLNNNAITNGAGYITGYTVTESDVTNQEGAITIASSQVSDFDTEVGNNSDVAANTAKVTNATHTGDVTGSGALTIGTGKVTNDMLAGSIDETKLDASVNTSLDLADSSSQATGVEDNADVTDTANVTSAGALMASNDLSDISNATTAISNLGLDTLLDAKLNLAGGTMTGALLLGGDLDVNGNDITSATGLDISIGGSAGNDFTIDTNKLVVEGDTGNVGINTTTPSAKLQIKGDGTTTGEVFSLLDSTGSDLVTVLDSGKVGIGTDSPKYAFSANPQTNASYTGQISIGVDSTYGAGPVLFLDGYNEASTYKMYVDNSGGFHLASPNDTEVLSASNSGVSMDRLITTNAGTAVSPSLTLDKTSSSEVGLYVPGGIGSNTLGFVTDRLERMRINADGNVGIGLTPTANMDGLSIESGLLTLKERATPTADTNYGKIYTKTDNKLYFQDGAGSEHEIAFV